MPRTKKSWRHCNLIMTMIKLGREHPYTNGEICNGYGFGQCLKCSVCKDKKSK